jgi:hypothetical protein
MTRQQKDHERYILHREQRLERQRAYYIAHREYYLSYMKRLANEERNKIYGVIY